MSRIAFIPAKYTSQRLPGKNALRICGKPLFLRSALAARESGLFNAIYISTEDDNIALEAIEAGFQVIARLQRLSEPHVGVVEVILETCPPCDTLCCIYPSPFIKAKWLQESRLMLDRDYTEMVMAVQRYDHHQLLLDLDCNPMPVCYQSCGAFYWANWNVFRQERTFYGSDCTGYEIPQNEHIDINTPEDFHKAEALYKTLNAEARYSGSAGGKVARTNGLFAYAPDPQENPI